MLTVPQGPPGPVGVGEPGLQGFRGPTGKAGKTACRVQSDVCCAVSLCEFRSCRDPGGQGGQGQELGGRPGGWRQEAQQEEEEEDAAHDHRPGGPGGQGEHAVTVVE